MFIDYLLGKSTPPNTLKNKEAAFTTERVKLCYYKKPHEVHPKSP